MVSNNSVITAVGLSKVFRDFWRRPRVKAVSDLDLQIQPGEIFGLLGPNGSGKSTTIKMILGLLYPTRGRIAVFDRPPDDVAIKSRIGYLPEESYLYRFLNGREVLDFFGKLFHIPRGERRRRTEQLLEMVGLKSAARRRVGEYSKGMARRIGLAQALINDPDLLILDEPTSGLDPIGSNLVKDLIHRLGREHGKTILLSSHLLADVEVVCDRVSILYGGVCRAHGPIRELLSRSDQTQFTVERLAPDTVRAIQELIQSREGKSAHVSAPSDKLEALFMRIVNEARAQRVETSGAVSGDLAGFLGADGQARALLDSLVRPAERAPESPKAPAPSPASQQLLSEMAAPHKPAVPDVAPDAEVDVEFLKGLSGSDEGRKP